jgi:hypothetical protein
LSGDIRSWARTLIVSNARLSDAQKRVNPAEARFKRIREEYQVPFLKESQIGPRSRRIRPAEKPARDEVIQVDTRPAPALF